MADFAISPVYQALASDGWTYGLPLRVVVVCMYQVAELAGNGCIVVLVCGVQERLIVSATRIVRCRSQGIELILVERPVWHLVPNTSGGLIEALLEFPLGRGAIHGAAQFVGGAWAGVRQQAGAVCAVVCAVVVVSAAGGLALALRYGRLAGGAYGAAGVLTARYSRSRSWRGCCLVWCLTTEDHSPP